MSANAASSWFDRGPAFPIAVPRERASFRQRGPLEGQPEIADRRDSARLLQRIFTQSRPDRQGAQGMVEVPRQVEKVLTMTYWYGNGMGTGGWLAMIAMMTIFWGLVILAGVMIFRGGGSRSLDGTQDRGAGELLDERFARGDVDREEYEARRATLRGSAR